MLPEPNENVLSMSIAHTSGEDLLIPFYAYSIEDNFLKVYSSEPATDGFKRKITRVPMHKVEWFSTVQL